MSLDIYSEDSEHTDAQLVHAYKEPQQMPKWAHFTLYREGDHVEDPPDQRRTTSHFEEPPHSLESIEPIMHMHCYIIQASNPHPYVEAAENLLENQTRDLVPLPSDRKLIRYRWVHMMKK
jgi:hypothetical protein